MKLPLMLITNIFFNSLASFLLKLGMGKIGKSSSITDLLLKMITSPKIIIGGCCFAAGFFVYCLLLQNYPLKLVYPIVTSGSLISITMLSLFVLHEPITLSSVAGIVLIAAGILVISTGYN